MRRGTQRYGAVNRRKKSLHACSNAHRSASSHPLAPDGRRCKTGGCRSGVRRRRMLRPGLRRWTLLSTCSYTLGWALAPCCSRLVRLFFPCVPVGQVFPPSVLDGSGFRHWSAWNSRARPPALLAAAITCGCYTWRPCMLPHTDTHGQPPNSRLPAACQSGHAGAGQRQRRTRTAGKRPLLIACFVVGSGGVYVCRSCIHLRLSACAHPHRHWLGHALSASCGCPVFNVPAFPRACLPLHLS